MKPICKWPNPIPRDPDTSGDDPLSFGPRNPRGPYPI